MPEGEKALELVLGPEDARLLAALKLGTGASQSDILRWALRYYVVAGPWAANKRARKAVIGSTEPLCVGPKYQEVE